MLDVAWLASPAVASVLGVVAMVSLLGGIALGRRFGVSARRSRSTGRLERLEAQVAEALDVARRVEDRTGDQRVEIARQLDAMTRTHTVLVRAAEELRHLLAQAPTHGRWGDRMAGDVLRAAGFVEGIDYRTRLTTASGARPDLSFLLPGGRVVHMDVQFPLSEYVAMVRDGEDADRAERVRSFLRAVRGRIDAISEHGHIDPADGTTDCALLFVPNDRIHAMALEHDPTLLDDALARGVILCTPSTLFAVLVVIRQSVERFAGGPVASVRPSGS